MNAPTVDSCWFQLRQLLWDVTPWWQLDGDPPTRTSPLGRFSRPCMEQGSCQRVCFPAEPGRLGTLCTKLRESELEQQTHNCPDQSSQWWELKQQAIFVVTISFSLDVLPAWAIKVCHSPQARKAGRTWNARWFVQPQGRFFSIQRWGDWPSFTHQGGCRLATVHSWIQTPRFSKPNSSTVGVCAKWPTRPHSPFACFARAMTCMRTGAGRARTRRKTSRPSFRSHRARQGERDELRPAGFCSGLRLPLRGVAAAFCHKGSDLWPHMDHRKWRSAEEWLELNRMTCPSRANYIPIQSYSQIAAIACTILRLAFRWTTLTSLAGRTWMSPTSGGAKILALASDELMQWLVDTLILSLRVIEQQIGHRTVQIHEPRPNGWIYLILIHLIHLILPTHTHVCGRTNEAALGLVASPRLGLVQAIHRKTSIERLCLIKPGGRGRPFGGFSGFESAGSSRCEAQKWLVAMMLRCKMSSWAHELGIWLATHKRSCQGTRQMYVFGSCRWSKPLDYNKQIRSYKRAPNSKCCRLGSSNSFPTLPENEAPARAPRAHHRGPSMSSRPRAAPRRLPTACRVVSWRAVGLRPLSWTPGPKCPSHGAGEAGPNSPVSVQRCGVGPRSRGWQVRSLVRQLQKCDHANVLYLHEAWKVWAWAEHWLTFYLDVSSLSSDSGRSYHWNHQRGMFWVVLRCRSPACCSHLSGCLSFVLGAKANGEAWCNPASSTMG